MNKLTTLHILVFISAIYSAAALIFLYWKTQRFGKVNDLSLPAGNAHKGIRYAFGKGMMPWEKESAAKHLPTFLGGIIYHSALLTGLLFIFWDILRLPLPHIILTLLKILWFAGLAAGVALLIKRALSPKLRRLSCPDDFFANLLADVYLALTLLAATNDGWKNLMYIFAMILFIYIPFGKIRHCFFFFTTRIIFGKFFGRRGVFPGPSRETK